MNSTLLQCTTSCVSHAQHTIDDMAYHNKHEGFKQSLRENAIWDKCVFLYMGKWSPCSSVAAEPSVIGPQHRHDSHESSLKEV